MYTSTLLRSPFLTGRVLIAARPGARPAGPSLHSTSLWIGNGPSLLYRLVERPRHRTVTGRNPASCIQRPDGATASRLSHVRHSREIARRTKFAGLLYSPALFSPTRLGECFWVRWIRVECGPHSYALSTGHGLYPVRRTVLYAASCIALGGRLMSQLLLYPFVCRACRGLAGIRTSGFRLRIGPSRRGVGNNQNTDDPDGSNGTAWIQETAM